jgi:hypothetical protein
MPALVSGTVHDRRESKRRGPWLFSLLSCALLLGAAPDEAARLRVSVPESLRVGDHVALVITLDLPAGELGPLLVTPRSQGEALEVVRGRLLLSDARDANARPLVFHVPAIARAPGQALVNVRALVYRCADGACEPLTLDTQTSVLVLPR